MKSPLMDVATIGLLIVASYLSRAPNASAQSCGIQYPFPCPLHILHWLQGMRHHYWPRLRQWDICGIPV